MKKPPPLATAGSSARTISGAKPHKQGRLVRLLIRPYSNASIDDEPLDDTRPGIASRAVT